MHPSLFVRRLSNSGIDLVYSILFCFSSADLCGLFSCCRLGLPRLFYFHVFLACDHPRVRGLRQIKTYL